MLSIDKDTGEAPVQKIDIAFFFCPYTGHPPPHRFDINPGPAYLAAYLLQHGLRSSFYYGTYDNDPDFGRIMAYIKRTAPRTIGFTVYGSNLPETVHLSRAIKKQYPNIPIIWGGPQVRFNPGILMEKYRDCLDICVSGEGELPIKRLLRIPDPYRPDDLEKIPGISFYIPGISFYKGPSRAIVTNPIGRTLIAELGKTLDPKKTLDVYPSPFLEGIIPDAYFYDKSVVSIFTSRGCPYQCVYCQFSSLTDHKVHFHSVERVMAEIRWIHAKVRKYHPHKEEIMIMVFDEALTLSRKRIEVLCRELIDHPFDPPLKLWVETRADHVDEELLNLLKRAGAKKINFGLESAVPSVLKRIRKVSNNTRRPASDLGAEKRFLKKIKKAVDTSKRLGMFTSVSTIVGLPEESLEDARKTLRFVKALDVDMYYHNFLNVLDGTALSKEATDLGYDWQHAPTGYMGKYGHRFTKAPVDTRSLMPLPNARIFIRDKARFKFLLRGYIKPPSGMLMTAKDPIRGQYAPFALDLTRSKAESDYVKRLFEGLIGLSATVFCSQDILSQYPDLLNLFAALPLGNGRLYKVPEGKTIADRIHGIEESDQSTPYYYPFKLYKGPGSGDAARSLFLYLDDMEDVDRFEQEWDPYFDGIKKGKSAPGPDGLPFELFESCRWVCSSPEGCPATHLTHLYADEDNALRPCRYFSAMTGEGEVPPLETLRSRVQDRIDDVRAQRGCRDCDIHDLCPKCTAPYPLSDEAYCAKIKKLWSKT